VSAPDEAGDSIVIEDLVTEEQFREVVQLQKTSVTRSSMTMESPASSGALTISICCRCGFLWWRGKLAARFSGLTEAGGWSHFVWRFRG